MASAFLHSRNEPRSSDISKFTNNSKLNFTRLENITTPNPNPNPSPSPNPSHFFIGNTSRDVIWKNREQRPSALPPPGVAFAGSMVNSAPVNSYGYRYITFRLSSYTRRELKELKKRLISDLERVRALRHWVCSTPVPKKNYHPPQLELPTAPEVVLKGKERQKSAVGQKRTKPAPSIRDTKKHCGRGKNNVQRSKVVMRKCGQILAKLMKHKHGWVFNAPVDAAALKLYDYHTIITNPMDLGTIKSKLAKNEYDSPLAFASDVRLTFQNAMVYNGKGSGVFLMAERLLLLFEDMFNQTPQKTMGNQPKKQNRSAKVPLLMEKPVSDAAAVPLEIQVSNVTTLNQVAPQLTVLRKSVILEKPKPMAMAMQMSMGRDAKKPLMTAEEKSELAASLLNLQIGPEGMDQIMGIIKKGVLGVEHEGDEIELDLAVLDDETLWELHSFISSSCKKVATTSNINTNLVSYVQANNADIGYQCAGSKVEEEGRKRERDGGEEDIDIGEEEMGVGNFPSVEIEKDGVSSCSSSSDSSSSSSDSGSGSDSSSSSGNGCSGKGGM